MAMNPTDRYAAAAASFDWGGVTRTLEALFFPSPDPTLQPVPEAASPLPTLEHCVGLLNLIGSRHRVFPFRRSYVVGFSGY